MLSGPRPRAAAPPGGARWREPLSGRAILIASLPIAWVHPTPFQRDLFPTHVKRLAKKIEESGSFLDPLIVVRGAGGRLWTPNGRHRLAAAKLLGLQQVTALVSPDEDLAFRILALNTEKAHNLKDHSLEVIRMTRELAERRPPRRRATLWPSSRLWSSSPSGSCTRRTSGSRGARTARCSRKVDRFRDQTLRRSLRERQALASRLLTIDEEVRAILERLRSRGFRSPYLRNYVVARINPVRFHRAKKGETEPPMAIGAALTRMAAAARKFDLESVRSEDLALVAAVSGGE